MALSPVATNVIQHQVVNLGVEPIAAASVTVTLVEPPASLQADVLFGPAPRQITATVHTQRSNVSEYVLPFPLTLLIVHVV